ncbi:MAG: hypothetical protein EBQ92_00205 [Proteobacteria bacterium]|nr:hypothetical protein [Pseudomonadota bacterium]
MLHLWEIIEVTPLFGVSFLISLDSSDTKAKKILKIQLLDTTALKFGEFFRQVDPSLDLLNELISHFVLFHFTAKLK